MDLSHVTARQRAYFRSGATLPLPARRRALEALLRGLADREDALLAALEADIEAAASDYQRLSELLAQKEEADAALAALMEQWEEASLELES